MLKRRQHGNWSSMARLSCALFLLGVASPARAQTVYRETILHNFAFGQAPRGATPYGGVIRDEAGNLYGTTIGGGAWGAGVVYKVDTAGHQTVLHGFTGGSGGKGPSGPLTRDSAGNLYGTTESGGHTCSGFSPPGCGIVYKLDTAGNYTVLYSFTGGSDGAVPLSGVVRDPAGNLYGTAVGAGKRQMGVVFKLDPAGHQTVLHNFTGGADGGFPNGVLLDSGNLYGTTSCGGTGTDCPGGATGQGVVYKLDASGAETVLYTFSGGADGSEPYADVIRDSEGNLYGTTAYGGIGFGRAGQGVVFKVDPLGQQTVLYTFTGGRDGGVPIASLLRDPAGNLYGTTSSGGNASCTFGCGVLFKLNTAGQATTLHEFTGTDGSEPGAGVISDSEGDLYGTTEYGGVTNAGVVFKLDDAGQETVLYSFLEGADGVNPNASVVRDSAGNFYGTTVYGGMSSGGVVYKLDATGHYMVLHSFHTIDGNGAEPWASVVPDSHGNLYGTTYLGGAADRGVVFKLDPAGNETVLHTFVGGLTDGSHPTAGVVLDSAGNLYGTTTYGGTVNGGVLYKLDAAGHETILHAFSGGADGANPDGGVILDAAGNLYGTTTSGVVYKMDTAGNYTTLYTFTGGSDGSDLEAGVIRDAAGNLYGTAYAGGTAGYGLVYKLDPEGRKTALYTFTGAADGGNPIGGVILDPAGNLYGTTANAGTPSGSHGSGVVFKLDVAGNYTVIHTFTSSPDGRTPVGGVVLDPAGNLYGTTYNGGKQAAGVIFKLTPQ